MPLGGVHGMWSHQPSAFPPPSFAPLSPFLAQTGEFLYLCPFCILFVHFYTPLPIRTRFTRRGEYSPRISNRPDRLFTLVINTNCSIQTFEMCLTFLWHVIPLPPFPSPMLLSHFFCFSSYFSLLVCTMRHRKSFPLLATLHDLAITSTIHFDNPSSLLAFSV